MIRHCDGECGNPFCKIAQLEEQNEKMRLLLEDTVKQLEDRWKFEIVFRIKEYLREN